MNKNRALLVLPTKNNLKYLKETVYSILKYTSFPFRLLIINDHSREEPLVEYLKSIDDPRIEVIHQTESLGYGCAANEGIERLKPEEIIYGLLNSDIFVTPNWLTRLVEILKINPQMGIISPGTSWGAFGQSYNYAQENRLNWEEKEILKFAVKAQDLYGNRVYNWNHANGFCWIAKSEIWKYLGFFDEQFSPGYSEETDANMRARKAGIGIGHARGIYVHHRGNQAMVIEEMVNSKLRVNALRQICDQRFKQRWNQPQNAPVFIPRYPREEVKKMIQLNCQNNWEF